MITPYNKKIISLRIFFAFFIGLCFFVCCSPQNQEGQTVILQEKSFPSVGAKDFAPGQLEAHFIKHRSAFKYATKEEYLQGARQLLNSPSSRGILEKTRLNGDVLRYRVSTGEFAVMTKEGRIRTYFKADYRYWQRQ